MLGRMPAPADRPSPWSPLRIRVYRSLWIAGLVSNVGTFMHIVAAGWAMTSLTSSPTTVSMVQTAWTVPGFALALHAGAYADIVDRRRVIILTQLAALVVAGALGALEVTDHLTVGTLLAGTFLLSIALTMAGPAFMAFTPELVGLDELPRAIGLDSISRNIAQSVGPALAGLVIAASGPGAVFLVNAASFVGIVIVLRGRHHAVAPDAADAPDDARETVNTAIRSGVQFFRRSPRLRRIAGRLTLTWGLTVALTALMPVAARGNLHTSAGEFGVLSAALGVGAVAAVWAIPRLAPSAGPDAIALVGAVGWSAGVAVFAATGSVPVAVIGLVLAGGGAMATINTLFAAYLAVPPSWVRGRAASVAMLSVWLGASIGASAWGALGSATSVRTALLVAATVQLAAAGVTAIVWRVDARQ
jgi:predicted MFS family arabinose efflux permease